MSKRVWGGARELPGKEVDGSELVFAGPEPRLLLNFVGRPPEQASFPLTHTHTCTCTPSRLQFRSTPSRQPQEIDFSKARAGYESQAIPFCLGCKTSY